MSGIVLGTVRDQNAQLIPGATVAIPGVLVHMSSGFYSGVYSSGGSHALTASAPGFGPQCVTKPFLDGGTTTVQFVLTRA